MTHEGRLAIAKELAQRMVDAYDDALLAIYVTSSTAKGLDREYSDLEITAVVHDGMEIDKKSYVYRGILVEIEYPQESRLLRAARKVTSKWPIEADGYRSRLVLFERDGWLRGLDEAVAESEVAETARALHLATTSLIENRDKVRNARLAEDAMDVRVNGFWAADAAANLVLLLNRRYMTTSSWFYRQALDCPEQPQDFHRYIETLLGLRSATTDEVADAVERLTENLIQMVAARGVVVESTELIV